MKTEIIITSFRQRAWMSVLLSLVLLLMSQFTWAHGGEIEVNSGGNQGPVKLTPEQQKALALTTAPAEARPLANLLSLSGTVQLLPNQQADVTVRISGQVTDVLVNLGDEVKVGQPLMKVQTRLVGDPPPIVVIASPLAGIVDARNVNLGRRCHHRCSR